MSRRALYILVFLIAQANLAQVTFVVKDIPKSTSSDESIYISGDFENWSGGQKAYKLSEKNDTYFITIPNQKESISYKFTQGSWDTVESDSNGLDIENRKYSFKNKADTIYVKIQGWRIKNQIESTSSCNVSILSQDFDMPQLDRKRRIWIYLPPDYQDTNEHYPVLYMHDGQNLFDVYTSYAGEWEIDETLDNLFKSQQFKLIVVGIDNGQETRMNEYSPWDNKKFGKGEGELYMQFIVNTLKPFVDSNYRTLSNREETAIMGSSMGGLISYYAGFEYADIFGKVGVFSPSFWYSKCSFEMAKTNTKEMNTKMYFVVGDEEGSGMVSNMKKMIKMMKRNGFNEKNINQKVVKGAQHNEQFWKDEFEEAVLWLYNK